MFFAPITTRALCAFVPALALGAALALPAQAQTPAALPPIEAFFANPLLDDAELSPSGRYLAAVSGAPGRRDTLIVVDLQENKAQAVAGYKDADVLNFQWVNDERLMFNVTDKQVGPGGRVMASGLYAVNRDGGGMRQLANRRGVEFYSEGGSRLDRRILPWHTFMMSQRGPQDSNAVYVQSYELDERNVVENVNLLRLDTVTGQVQTVQRPGTVDTWMLDNAGEPRLARRSEGGKTIIHYREPGTGKWRQIAQFDTYKGSQGAFTPVGFGADGTLYVRAYGNADTTELHTFDLASGKVNPQAVVVTPGYDFTGALVSRRDKVLGALIETDAMGSVWFDKDMAAVQQNVDKLLPGRVNLISVAARAEAPWVLVRSFSDVLPLSYSLYNLKTGKLNAVGNSRDGIDPARMGRQDPVRYTARDGREIPALLTLPAGGANKNLPLVVLVHGGPYVRGNHWGWHPETQFLASRGYAVLEPDFRGSRGYGVKHYQAGWKQWGLKMQDDIADGARWAIAQGTADPKRICIAGASYGGYAALMGLVNDPDLYKCGINWAGVTDINLLYENWSFDSDLGEEYKSYGMPVLIGDRLKDAAQLKATSPIEQAARITQPLLLAYGAVDRRVPLQHGNRFHDAVKAHNKQVEWIVYQDEGHGWAQPANSVDFWKRVESFLGRHIGAGAAR